MVQEQRKVVATPTNATNDQGRTSVPTGQYDKPRVAMQTIHPDHREAREVPDLLLGQAAQLAISILPSGLVTPLERAALITQVADEYGNDWRIPADAGYLTVLKELFEREGFEGIFRGTLSKWLAELVGAAVLFFAPSVNTLLRIPASSQWSLAPNLIDSAIARAVMHPLYRASVRLQADMPSVKQADNRKVLHYRHSGLADAMGGNVFSGLPQLLGAEIATQGVAALVSAVLKNNANPNLVRTGGYLLGSVLSYPLLVSARRDMVDCRRPFTDSPFRGFLGHNISVAALLGSQVVVASVIAAILTATRATASTQTVSR